MGHAGRHSVHGRRLCRSSVVRSGRGRPPAGGRGPARGDRAAAQLARRPARFPQAGTPEAILRRIGRQHGLDGQPLHGQQKAAQRRRLHRRRTSRIPARLCGHGLHAHPEAAVPRHAGRARRHRGLAAEAHALRLLERLAEAVDPYRQRSRPAGLRHGRPGDAGNRPSRAQRFQHASAQEAASSRFRGRPEICRLAGRRAAEALPVRAMPERQARLRRKLPAHRNRVEPHGSPHARRRDGGPFRSRQPALPQTVGAGTGPQLRAALHPAAASALQRQRRHPGIRDDQVLGQPAPGLFRRVQFLYDFGPSGQVRVEPQRAVRLGRGPRDHRHARIQGLPVRSGRPVGQHVPDGRTQRGALPAVQPPVLPVSRPLPQPAQRPPSAD